MALQDVPTNKRDSYVNILTYFNVNWPRRCDPDPDCIINMRNVGSRKVMVPGLISKNNNQQLKNE